MTEEEREVLENCLRNLYKHQESVLQMILILLEYVQEKD